MHMAFDNTMHAHDDISLQCALCSEAINELLLKMHRTSCSFHHDYRYENIWNNWD